jgi:hypothetical protein
MKNNIDIFFVAVINKRPGSGHSIELRVAQYKNKARVPDNKSPWPPHLLGKK